MTRQKQPPEVFYKKCALKNFAIFTGKYLCQSIFLPQVCNFINKEILAQVFSCELCEISRNTFFTGHLQTTASAKRRKRTFHELIIIYQVPTALWSYEKLLHQFNRSLINIENIQMNKELTLTVKNNWFHLWSNTQQLVNVSLI